MSNAQALLLIDLIEADQRWRNQKAVWAKTGNIQDYASLSMREIGLNYRTKKTGEALVEAGLAEWQGECLRLVDQVGEEP